MPIDMMSSHIVKPSGFILTALAQLQMPLSKQCTPMMAIDPSIVKHCLIQAHAPNNKRNTVPTITNQPSLGESWVAL